MYKKKIILLFLIYNPYVFAQVSAYIINSETKVPVPYANIGVENEQIGTFANEEGKFILRNITPEKKLAFTAVGYEKKVITVRDISDTIYLKPQITLLSEVRIMKRQNSLKFKIGRLKGKTVLICDLTPNEDKRLCGVAKFFQSNVIYEKTPFIKKIKLRTECGIKGRFLNLMFYTKGNTGNPETFLYDNNIIYEIKKGKDRVQTIDVSKLNIIVPADGFFVAVQGFVPVNDKVRGFGPGIIFVEDNINSDTWMTVNGVWRRYKKTSFAMEVELSN